MADIRSEERDPLRRTKRQIRGFLSNWHELSEVYTRACDPSITSSGAGFTPGAWWEGLACMRCDIQQAMQTLTRRQAEAIGLYYIVGLSPRDAQEEMGAAERTFWDLIARGIRNMAEYIGPDW